MAHTHINSEEALTAYLTGTRKPSMDVSLPLYEGPVDLASCYEEGLDTADSESNFAARKVFVLGTVKHEQASYVVYEVASEASHYYFACKQK